MRSVAPSDFTLITEYLKIFGIYFPYISGRFWRIKLPPILTRNRPLPNVFETRPYFLINFLNIIRKIFSSTDKINKNIIFTVANIVMLWNKMHPTKHPPLHEAALHTGCEVMKIREFPHVAPTKFTVPI